MKKDILQDMAVRFTIALIKEEYDFNQCQVMDQIYWFVMFILSARIWFEPQLRHHVYKVAKNCFAVFKPPLLRLLEELKRTSNEKRRRYFCIGDGFHGKYNDTYSYLSRKFTFNDKQNEYLDRYWFFYRSSERPCRKVFHSIYEGEEWFSCTEESHGKDPLELIYERVLEIMYVRLQTETWPGARGEFRRRTNPYKLEQTQSYLPTSLYLFDREILLNRIDDISESDCVREEIDALILQDICYLTPLLEHEHAKLMQSIQEDDQQYGTSNEDIERLIFWWLFHGSSRTAKREKAVRYEVLLDKLYKDQCNIVDKIRQRVLCALNVKALNQLKQWEKTQGEIDALESDLKQFKQGKNLHQLIQDLKLEIERWRQTNNFLQLENKKSKNQQYHSTTFNPLSNRHFQHGKR